MINLSIVNDLGTFDFFVLTGFREQTFPGEDSRFRLPLKVDSDNSEYESEEENQHIDFAARAAQAKPAGHEFYPPGWRI